MLLAASISHTTGVNFSHYHYRCMDFVEVINRLYWICLLFIFLILVGVELPLCITVTLS